MKTLYLNSDRTPKNGTVSYVRDAKLTEVIFRAVVTCIIVDGNRQTFQRPCSMKLTTHLHLVPRSKDAWRYTSIPPIRLHGVVLDLKKKHEDNFSLPFMLYIRLKCECSYIMPLDAVPNKIGYSYREKRCAI